MNKNTYVAIMAGGIGSRFWPMSRENRPKQFLDMLDTGHSLIRTTFDRFAQFVPPENIYIVTNQSYIEQILEHIPSITRAQILAEPSRRNTAPCVAYVSYKIRQQNPDANLVVAPSDHLIKNQEEFQHIIEKGVDFVAKNNALLTLGIRPDWANTGYGYIQFLDEENSEKGGIKPVKTFTEKPNEELAKEFLRSGDFLWNSGIFLWSVKSITEAMEQLMPEMSSLFLEMYDDFNSEREEAGIKQVYWQCTNESIDYGIMEKAENTFVLPADFGWCDLGTWQSLWEQSAKDADKNALLGDKINVYDSNNNVVVSSSSKKLIVLQGMEDYIVVDTEDALLICKKSSEQAVKAINKDVRETFGDEFM